MSTSFAQAQSEPSVVKAILERSLIIGASVSADHFTASPGKRLALKYTTANQIKVMAANGRLGRDNMKALTHQMLRDRTAVIGVDLFFWDSFHASPAATLQAIDQLMARAEQQNLVVVVGDVPSLMPSMQPGVFAINARLKQACRDYAGCRLLPLSDFLQKAAQDGYVDYRGKRYPIEELLPDGLHIAEPASAYLADEIEKLL